jgi:hypothetical protein
MLDYLRQRRPSLQMFRAYQDSSYKRTLLQCRHVDGLVATVERTQSIDDRSQVDKKMDGGLKD